MAEIHIISVISKLRPRVAHRSRIPMDVIADEIADESGYDRGTTRDIAYKLARKLVEHLQWGDSVNFAELGDFRIEVDKSLKKMIKYRAAKETSSTLQIDFRGEILLASNVGLDDEGYAARWLEEHPEDTVIMRDGSTRTAGG